MSFRQESDITHLERLLREANKRIEQEQYCAEDKQQSRKEAEDKTEKEQQHVEEEQHNRQVADK